jgi:hypothetical protein
VGEFLLFGFVLERCALGFKGRAMADAVGVAPVCVKSTAFFEHPFIPPEEYPTVAERPVDTVGHWFGWDLDSVYAGAAVVGHWRTSSMNIIFQTNLEGGNLRPEAHGGAHAHMPSLQFTGGSSSSNRNSTLDGGTKGESGGFGKEQGLSGS